MVGDDEGYLKVADQCGCTGQLFAVCHHESGADCSLNEDAQDHVRGREQIGFLIESGLGPSEISHTFTAGTGRSLAGGEKNLLSEGGEGGIETADITETGNGMGAFEAKRVRAV
ncbi:hypothetical protein [Caballeronia sp.]|uniref:hypothetical protein n=1 Tax=Caballeronia sp. TaxID=1931223 RepID=UPI003C670EE8